MQKAVNGRSQTQKKDYQLSLHLQSKRTYRAQRKDVKETSDNRLADAEGHQRKKQTGTVGLGLGTRKRNLEKRFRYAYGLKKDP